jgi:hypothetical protein
LEIVVIENIKNIANIVFFLTVSIVGVLSYVHAKRTVFAPLRTETFKLQLKVLEELFEFFQHKGEVELGNDFDFQSIVALNTLQLRDAYVKAFFGNKLAINEEGQKKRRELLPYALISEEFLEPIGEDDHRKPAQPPRSVPDSPALQLAEWKTYKHGSIGFTRKYSDHRDALQRFVRSPLLPEALRDKLRAYDRIAAENLMHVGQVLTEAAQDLPEKFNTVEEVQKFRPDWAWNRFNNKMKPFEPTANEILKFVNDYLKVDRLTSLEA